MKNKKKKMKKRKEGEENEKEEEKKKERGGEDHLADEGREFGVGEVLIVALEDGHAHDDEPQNAAEVVGHVDRH